MLKGKIDTKSVRKLKWLFKEMKMDNALTKINIKTVRVLLLMTY